MTELLFQKLASIQKQAANASIRFLRGKMRSGGLDSMFDSASKMQSRGFLPRGKMISDMSGKLDGQENNIKFHTSGVRGVNIDNNPVMVEKMPKPDGLYTSRHKHERLLGLVDKTKGNPDFIPMQTAPASNPKHKYLTKNQAQTNQHVYSPFVRNMSEYGNQFKGKNQHLPPIFARSGRLNDLRAPSESNFLESKKMVREGFKKPTNMGPGYADITDLKADNFVMYKGRPVINDFTPSDPGVFGSHKILSRRALAKGSIINPGLDLKDTLYDRGGSEILKKVSPKMLLKAPSVLLDAKKAAKKIGYKDTLLSLGMNTRANDNAAFAKTYSTSYQGGKFLPEFQKLRGSKLKDDVTNASAVSARIAPTLSKDARSFIKKTYNRVYETNKGALQTGLSWF
jgi:hypothetical protein